MIPLSDLTKLIDAIDEDAVRHINLEHADAANYTSERANDAIAHVRATIRLARRYGLLLDAVPVELPVLPALKAA